MNLPLDPPAEHHDGTARFSGRSVVFAAKVSALTIASPSAYAAASKMTKKKATTKKATITTSVTTMAATTKSGSALPADKNRPLLPPTPRPTPEDGPLRHGLKCGFGAFAEMAAALVA